MSIIDLTPTSADPEMTNFGIANKAEVVTIWGSAGSGKSMLAANLAFELAALRNRVLLVDLDSRRPAQAALLGLTDAGPGITAVTRLARQGRLDLSELERLSAEIKFGSNRLDVITGMNSHNRWPELDASGLSGLLELATAHYDYLLLDVNDELEEGLVSVRSEADRNFSTRWALDVCDKILGVFAADPVGINRFLFDVRQFTHEYWPIGNFVSTTNLGKNPEKQIRQALHQVGRIDPRALLPEDRAATTWQVATAKPIILSPKNSRLGAAIHTLALDLMDSRSRPLNSDT